MQITPNNKLINTNMKQIKNSQVKLLSAITTSKVEVTQAVYKDQKCKLVSGFTFTKVI